MINVSFSFDCEGRWGMLDNLNSPYVSQITNASLLTAYEKLLSILERHDTNATFGFVASMLLSRSEFNDLSYKFADEKTKRWLAPIFSKTTDITGFFLPGLVDLFAGKSFEIASHSLTHIPHQFIEADAIACEREMRYSKKIIDKLFSTRVDCYIYPRNQVINNSFLVNYGYKYYRANSSQSKFSKIFGFLADLSFSEYCDKTPAAGNENYGFTKPLNPGIFIPWAYGWRKIFINVERVGSLFQKMIESSDDDRNIHFWMHPHNFINNEIQFKILEELLCKIDYYCQSGLAKKTLMTEGV